VSNEVELFTESYVSLLINMERSDASERRVECSREFRTLQLQLQKRVDALVENKKHISRKLLMEGICNKIYENVDESNSD